MQPNHTYNLDLLWQASNDGLDYFHEVYPESIGKENKNKHFKTHVEDSASTTLSNKNKNKTTGVYRIYNHALKEGMNAVDHCMKEYHMDFPAACNYLFHKYNIAKNAVAFYKSETTWQDTTKPLGYYKVTKAKKTDNFKFFAPFLTTDICKEYEFFSLDSYESVKEVGEAKKLSLLTAKPTENYPIFGYVQKDFTKIYEPKAVKNDKGFSTKHSFLGTKPDRFVYGLKRLKEKVELEELLELWNDYYKLKNKEDKAKKMLQIQFLQLDQVIICTGGSDGLNVASLGFDVIWYNSEAEIINKDEYALLSKIAKVIYYIPDNDKTGVNQAVKMGMKFLKIKMLWLPETLKTVNKKKDIADWVCLHKNLDLELVKNMFKQILSQALEFQFWEYSEKRGDVLNNKKTLNFLKYNGFGLYKLTTKSADASAEIEKTRIIHVNKNIIKTVSPREVKNFVLQWLEENFIDIKIYNLIIKSIYFSENALLLLPEIEINTKTGTHDSQLYFFRNKVVKITKNNIEVLDHEAVPNKVWKNDVIDHHFELQKKPFEISKDESGNWKIDILNDASNYLKVLINTSRMFWEKDADTKGNDLHKFKITSDNLSPEENGVQMLQLINKNFVIGYMGHKFKTKQKAFFPIGVDNKIGNLTTEANGGSGKTFLQESMKCLLKNWKEKSGKLLPKENPQFIFDKVTKNTDYVYWDDLTQYQDYNFFYTFITGVLEVNNKGGEIIDLEFAESPKTGCTTNYVPMNLTDALERRSIFYYCSNYYHQKTANNDYPFTRQISYDFDGKEIMGSDYPSENWNNEYNFIFYCIQFFLNQPEKIDAPMEGLIIKNLRQKIGDKGLKFFDKIFIESEYLNKWVHKKAVFDYYKEELGSKAKSSQDFKDILQWYCDINKWELEIKKKKIDGTGNSVEHFYITTSTSIPKPVEVEEKENKQHFVEFDDPPEE